MAKRKSKSSSSSSSKSSSPRLSPDPAGQTSFDLASPDRPFDNILNFRDVGSSINKIHGSRIIKEGVLYRSARPDDASERDKKRLVDELTISTVIDLRSNTEHVMATKKRRASLYPETAEQDKPVPANPNEHILELPGVRRYSISLTGKAFEKALLWRLDWYNFMKVLGLSASGYRSDAITIVGRQVMQPRGLIGLAKDTLDNSISEMRELFDLLCDDSTYPTVVHCTQGKDRTGLVIMLLLFLTNAVPLDDITADYSKSEPELIPEMEERMKEIRAIGLDEEYTKCPPGFIRAIKTHLDNKYGGVEGYLLSVGISREKQQKVRNLLLA
ncbi:hypothetical protein DTO027B5_7729 [Paecilomyces variotii]|nr:hypothetical protein DTO169C6_5026 [Paecilomyces variotii]KAJ9242000.1 hypothetical protein DTO169E5_3221 [Paecilomyces variotii]KAJ9284478.1 hypothetical protein DTO021C3_7915 [Paecilomyces variotii]KAJ9303474.1 hypothetical protein DTO217A2_7064 [Paecilomyces variotii]KAJ9323428.1 hypothetical protein DTO027B3_5546 [Paecilomyces variotii]